MVIRPADHHLLPKYKVSSQQDVESFLDKRFPESAELTKRPFVRALGQKMLSLRKEASPYARKLDVMPMVLSSTEYEDYSVSMLTRDSFLFLVPGEEPELMSFDDFGLSYTGEFVPRHEWTHVVKSVLGTDMDWYLEEGFCDLRAYFDICGSGRDLYELVEQVAAEKEPFSFRRGRREWTVESIESVNECVGDLAKATAIVVMGCEYENPSPRTVVPTKREVSLALGETARQYIETGKGDLYDFASTMRLIDPRNPRLYRDGDGLSIKIDPQ